VTSTPPVPLYGEGTLAEVMPSAGALLGSSGVVDSLGLGLVSPGDVAGVTVLLVDGLGWSPWDSHLESTPALGSMAARRISTTFPSTTPTALTSLGTALAPGEHGLVGAAFRIDEEMGGEGIGDADSALLRPLSWGNTPHPVAVQPEPTVFERLMRGGIPVTLVGPSAYANSGLTRAGLRGGVYIGVESAEEFIEAVAHHRDGLTYAYLPELDRVGHVHGVSSEEWFAMLTSVDDMTAKLLESITERHVLVVTADHGMVDCADADRIVIDDLPGAQEAVIAGEPRMRHVYSPPATRVALVARWREELGERAWVLDRFSAISSGLFGKVSDDYVDRIGDIVVIARDGVALVSESDAIVSSLRGQHGALSPDEMGIPLLQARGRGHG
jgi:hypothetical protein